MDGPDPNISLAQAGPPRPPRGAGGFRPQFQDFLDFRLRLATDRLREAEPYNRNLARLDPPIRRPPSESEVLRMEAEADAAALRRGAPSAGPRRAEPQAPKSSADILFPGGNRIGTRLRDSGEDTTTVTAAELDRLAADLRAGAVATPNSRYEGVWFTRADGVQFGIRFSPKSGVTIDVNGDNYAAAFKTFRMHRFPWTE